MSNLFQLKRLQTFFHIQFLFICLFFFYFTQAEDVLQVSSSQSGTSPHDNFIGFDKVVDGSLVRVRYQCSRPCQLAVEVVTVAPTLRKTDLLVFSSKWISSTPRVPSPPGAAQIASVHFISTRLLQQERFGGWKYEVRAWLQHLKDSREPGTYGDAMVRIYKVLQLTIRSQHLIRPPTECPSWSSHLMWQVTRDRISQCPHESGQTPNLIFLILFISITKETWRYVWVLYTHWPLY